MTRSPHEVMAAYAFGTFLFVPERQLLTDGEKAVHLGGRAFDLLALLVERAGEVVSKQDLRSRAWPNVSVDPGGLKVNISTLRRALGDKPGSAKYIETVGAEGYRFIAKVQGSASPRSPVHNLPAASTRLIGRADALRDVRRQLITSRIVSIVGAGGIGKTTLAVAAAGRSIERFADGVWLVDFAPLADPNLVGSAIAMAVGLEILTSDIWGSLYRYLRERALLLIFDNCEHMTDTIAACARMILTEAPLVKIISTSRETLGIEHETVLVLPGLEMPAYSAELTAADAMGYAAIELFVSRASERLETYELTDPDVPHVMDICRKLDGLPLAIELAAMRVDAFGVAGLSRQMDDWFGILSGRRGGLERQRTLVSTIEWSYGLLQRREAELIRAISVFPGTFDIDGAATVWGEARDMAADTLSRLAGKSLLVCIPGNDGPSYRLLETTRRYCAERLAESDPLDMTRRRHADYVRHVLARAAEVWTTTPAQQWALIFGKAINDLRAALAWAEAFDGDPSLQIQLTISGNLLWNHFSFTGEAYTHVALAIKKLGGVGLAGTASEMKLQTAFAGALMFLQGGDPAVSAAMQTALEIATRLGDTEYRLRLQRSLGVYRLMVGEYDAAASNFADFIELAASADPSALPASHTPLAMLDVHAGRLNKARETAETVMKQYAQNSGDPQLARFQFDMAVHLGAILSWAQWLTGSIGEAYRTIDAAIERAASSGHSLSLCNALATSACPVAFWNGDRQRLERFVALLDNNLARDGVVTWRPIVQFYRGLLAIEDDEKDEHAINILLSSIDELKAINNWMSMPYFLGETALALSKFGDLEAGETHIQSAIDLSRKQNDRWCVPELFRIKALLLNARGRDDQCEEWLMKSIRSAQEMGARSWQLRSATDLADLLIVQSRDQEAESTLRSIRATFSEDLDTRDLARADMLLDKIDLR